ncbi:MAG TPA: MFS transporter [Dongiaceae bacterium]|nr:MFS transporter [Dongiaceae bacterium]
MGTVGAAADAGHLTSQRPSQRRLQGVVFLLSLSVLLCYVDRSNLSIAAEMIKGELYISDLQLGALLSAFFWVYACLQIPAGWLVDRFDVKWVLAAGFVLWSAATATTGLLHGFMALIAARVVLGIGESVAFPSYANIFSTHFTESQRGTANAALQVGLAMGPALGMLFGGVAVGRFGWRPFFLVLGAGSLLWLAPWIYIMPRRDESVVTTSQSKVRIVDIFRFRSAWGSCFGQFSLNYCMYLLVTWLPSFLIRTRHFTMNGMAKAGGVIFTAYAISAFVSGKVSDRWIVAGGSATRVRKTMLGVGLTGIGIALFGAAIVPDPIVVPVLALGGVLLAIAGTSSWAVAQTIAGPRVAGRWTGVQNFVGNMGGACAPVLTGYLLGRTGQFYLPLAIAAAIAWFGVVCWVLVVGRVEEIDWDQQLKRTQLSPRDVATHVA